MTQPDSTIKLGDLLKVGLDHGRPLACRLPTPAQALQKLLTISGIFKQSVDIYAVHIVLKPPQAVG